MLTRWVQHFVYKYHPLVFAAKNVLAFAFFSDPRLLVAYRLSLAVKTTTVKWRSTTPTAPHIVIKH